MLQHTIKALRTLSLAHQQQASFANDYRSQFEQLQNANKGDKPPTQSATQQEEQLKKKFYEDSIKDSKKTAAKLKSMFGQLKDKQDTMQFKDFVKDAKSKASATNFKVLCANLFKVQNPSTQILIDSAIAKFNKCVAFIISHSLQLAKYTKTKASKSIFKGLVKPKPTISDPQQKQDATQGRHHYFESKFPKIYKFGKAKSRSFVELWQQTFHPKIIGSEKLEETKKQAILENKNKLTEEQIAAIQATIPEWKRTAIALIPSPKPKAKSKLWSKISNTIEQRDVGKSFKETKAFEDLKTMRKNVTVMKDNISGALDSTGNPIISAVRNGLGNAMSLNETVKAVEFMKKVDPSFDIIDLPNEMEAVFTQIFEAYFNNDEAYLKLTCGEAVFSLYSQLIKKRITDVIS